MPKKKPVASFDYDSFITAFGGLSMSKENVATSSSSSEGVDLGELLIRFLKFYGEEFSYETKAIEFAPVPNYSTKTYGYSRYLTQRHLLSIYDPADTFIDMGSEAYGIKHIQASFRSAYQNLASLEAKMKSGRRGEAGLLGSVLGGDYTKFVEKRRLAVARTPRCCSLLKERNRIFSSA